jgi:hypothetical protein
MMKCHTCGVVTQHGKASRQEVGELKNRFEAFMGRGDDILDAASDRVFEFFARGQDRGGINGVFDGGVVIRFPSWIPRLSGRGGNEAPAEQGREGRFAAGWTGVVSGGR